MADGGAPVPRRPSQSEVNAAIRKVERAGKKVREVVFDPDGAIRIVLRDGSEGERVKRWEPV